MHRKLAWIGMSVVAGLTPAVSAAPVTWGTAFEFEAADDIDLSLGRMLYAVNGGDNIGNPALLPGSTPSPTKTVVVNGTPVVFEGVSVHYGAGSTFNSETTGDVTSHQPGSGHNVSFSVLSHRTTPIPQASFDSAPLNDPARVYNVTTGDDTLDSILNSQLYTDGRSVDSTTLVIDLNNLTPGESYRVQLIGSADSREARGTTIERRLTHATVNDGLGNTAANLGAYMDLDGDGDFHVTSILGSFTADASTQTINVVLANGRNHGISGLIVTAVPEPATVAISAAGAASFLLRRSRP